MAVGAAQRLRLDLAATEARPGRQLGAILAHDEDVEILETSDIGMMLTQPAEEPSDAVLVSRKVAGDTGTP